METFPLLSMFMRACHLCAVPVSTLKQKRDFLTCLKSSQSEEREWILSIFVINIKNARPTIIFKKGI